jgi:diguanylate cyclase (GGDEF)-like protein
LGLVRLSRIKSKIIVFSLLATFIPSLFMGWLSYRNNRQVLEEKINQELVNLTSLASRGLDYWFKDRVFEVRVFASSYEVSVNLDRMYRGEGSLDELDTPSQRLETYLASVEARFVDYEELCVADLSGIVRASSRGQIKDFRLPDEWLERIRAGEAAIGKFQFDDKSGKAIIPIAVPVRDETRTADKLLGVLVAKLDFEAVTGILDDYAPDNEDELYIITLGAAVLASSRPMSEAYSTSTLAPSTADDLFEHAGQTRAFTSFRGMDVVGTLDPTERLDWGVVAHRDRDEAYAQIVGLRNTTLFLMLTVLVLIGVSAYLLGLTIVGPLTRLTTAAAEIAAGNLKVRLPVFSGGELGYMTEVFNRMSRQLRLVMGELDATNKELREKNKELHELSITDALTSLHNRKHMMDTLAMEVARGLRYDKLFSILMIDIDDFKSYNDTFGHLPGDEVLRDLGAFLASTLRTEDYAARYGGEEFLLLLPETGSEGAGQLAERLRQRLEEKAIGAAGDHQGITVSIGVAAFPENGADPEELIRRADSAMYQAKQAGRNLVRVAKGRRGRKQTKS